VIKLLEGLDNIFGSLEVGTPTMQSYEVNTTKEVQVEVAGSNAPNPVELEHMDDERGMP
jgi:hypothetical protein